VMEQSKKAFQQGLRDGWTLLLSPFIGAWDEIQLTINRPQAITWREFILDDIRAFFAPAIGAARGFIGAFREIVKDEITKL
jgi:hypothetical protein